MTHLKGENFKSLSSRVDSRPKNHASLAKTFSHSREVELWQVYLRA